MSDNLYSWFQLADGNVLFEKFNFLFDISTKLLETKIILSHFYS